MRDILEPIPWNSAMEVGNASIDQDHKTMVTLYNDLVHAIHSHISPEMTEKFLRTVQNNLLDHMHREDKIFREFMHPLADMHAKQHEMVDHYLVKLTKKDGSSPDPEAIARFMRDLILDHVLVQDRLMFSSMPRSSKITEAALDPLTGRAPTSKQAPV